MISNVQSISNTPDFLYQKQDPTWHRVIIQNRVIPNILAKEWSDGAWEVLIDGRMSWVFSSKSSCYQAIKMAANAMAIGSGYKCLHSETKDHPFAPEHKEVSIID